MPSPLIRRPLEYYGEPLTDPPSATVRAAIQGEQCPFLGSRCVKSRKSDASQTIGSCIVKWDKAALIVCPKRLLQDRLIFKDCLSLLKGKGTDVVIPEIGIPGGTVDYWVVRLQGDQIVDYLGLEIQSLDTTGSVWESRVDALKGKLKDAYDYGINWKMSAKTILIQMSHKAPTFEALGKKLVLVLQSEFLAYIEEGFAAGHLRSANYADAIHFHAYDCAPVNGRRYQIALRTTKSTTASGIDQMLKLGDTVEITDAALRDRLLAKLGQAFRV